ncbi:MAG: homocysteine S-methyltransferase family protein [Candidatus Wenzhouxiangella sp. M2_3B_020]
MTMSTTGIASGNRLLLDGGMGQELAARGLETGDGLWSARALLDAPESVLAVHRDFVEAGADVITANSYAATRRRLDPADIEDGFVRCNRAAATLARQAADEAEREVLVAGSLPPIHGSYQPERVRPVDELEPLYREQAGILADSVDLFICETMSTAAEALAAARGAVATGLPVWVSWTVADDGSGLLRSGETLQEAIESLEGLDVEALLLNCSMPESVEAALPALSEHAGRAFGAYANGFSAIGSGFDVADGANVPDRREELTPERYAEHARRWLDAGASVVGGCCEVGPAHIAALRALI